MANVCCMIYPMIGEMIAPMIDACRCVLEIILNSWAYFASDGTDPQTWESMETGGAYERTWADLEI